MGKNKKGKRAQKINDAAVEDELETDIKKSQKEDKDVLYKIQCSFNFIMRVIRDVEKARKNKEGLTFLHTDIARLQKLMDGMKEEYRELDFEPSDEFNPQIILGKRFSLAREKGTSVVLTVVEVVHFESFLLPFPRNLIFDREKKTKEPYIRLMTRSEMKANLKIDDAICHPAEQYNLLRRRGRLSEEADEEEMAAMLEGTDIPFQDRLKKMILSMTPDDEDTVIPVARDQNNDAGDASEAAHSQKPTVITQKPSREAGKAKDDGPSETELNCLEEVQQFVLACADFYEPPALPGQRTSLRGILEAIWNQLKYATRAADSISKLNEELEMKLCERDKQLLFVRDLADTLGESLPGVTEKLKGFSDEQVDEHLALIRKEVEGLVQYREEGNQLVDDGIKKMDRLRHDVLERDKELKKASEALKSTQDSHHSKESKFRRDIEKKDSELAALQKQLKTMTSEHARYKEDSKKTIENLKSDVEKMEGQVSNNLEYIETLTSDFDASQAELIIKREESSRFEAMDAEISSLNTTLEQHKSTILSYRSSVKTEEDRAKKAVEAMRLSKDKEIADLKAEVEAMRKAKTISDGILKKDQVLLTEYKQEKDVLRSKLQDISSALAGVSAATVALNSDLDDSSAGLWCGER